MLKRGKIIFGLVLKQQKNWMQKQEESKYYDYWIDDCKPEIINKPYYIHFLHLLIIMLFGLLPESVLLNYPSLFYSKQMLLPHTLTFYY